MRRTLIEKAWLVAYLRPDGRYELGVFSEPSPTVMGGTWTAQIASGRGRDFAEARQELFKWIAMHLPVEVARYGDAEIRKAKGLAPRRGQRFARSGSTVRSAVGMCVSPRRVR